MFFLTVLKIPYLLLYKYEAETRRKFIEECPFLSSIYIYLLQYIGAELNLPVKRCGKCGISFLPDYRTGERQLYCPYGCVEANRRQNRRKAKARYRKKRRAKLLASDYNCLYRQRVKNGEIVIVPAPVDKKEEKEFIEKKLRSQIKFIYHSLYPETSAEKLEKLDGILHKLSLKMAAKYG